MNFWSTYLVVCTLKHVHCVFAACSGEMQYGYLAVPSCPHRSSLMLAEILKKNRQSKYISGKLGAYLAVCGLNSNSTWVTTLKSWNRATQQNSAWINKRHRHSGDLAMEKSSSSLCLSAGLLQASSFYAHQLVITLWYFTHFLDVPTRFRRFTYKQFHNNFGSLDNYINTKKSENTLFLLHLHMVLNR